MSDADRSLAYHRARAASRGAAPALGAMLDEGFAQLGRDAFAALMRGTGARLAAAHPLPSCTDIAELETAINAVLARLDWGWIEIAETEGAIEIAHHEHALLASTPEAAAAAAEGLLEGLYTYWLHVLGSDPALVAIAEPAQIDARLARLRFGRIR